MRISPYPNRASVFRTFTSIIVDKQVYVYYWGQLLLKKWLRQPAGTSKVFPISGNL